MTNTTTNTTKSTAASIFLALSVSLTMGVASATSVPGLNSDTFTFSKPGVTSGDANSAGGKAISHVNDIINAVGDTGGTDLSTDHFWNAMVDPTERNVFNYTNAAPMIEELIFTVTGEAWGKVGSGATDQWAEASTVTSTTLIVNNAYADRKTELLAKGSAVSTGSYIDANLRATREGAVALLSNLGFSVSNVANSLHEVNLVNDNNVTRQQVADKAISGQITTLVAAAELNEDGFNNANKLIALIANELKAGYILNVPNATATLASIADQHTGYLAAGLVSEAKGIKDMIQYLGLQEAAAGIGKGAKGACSDNNRNNSTTVCVEIGQKFKDIVQDLPGLGNTTVADYERALAAVNTFAGNIISFNNTVEGLNTDGSRLRPKFNAGGFATDITEQFGTIIVEESSQLYADLNQSPIVIADATLAADLNRVSGAISTDDNFVSVGDQIGLSSTLATQEDVDANIATAVGEILTSEQVIDREFMLIGDDTDMLGTDFADTFAVDIVRTRIATAAEADVFNTASGADVADANYVREGDTLTTTVQEAINLH